MKITKAICEHLKTKKKYNILELNYELLKEEYDKKVVELNNEKKTKKIMEESYKSNIEKLVEENIKLKKRKTKNEKSK